MQLAPVILEGRHVRLEPLTLAHAAPLWAVSDDQELWRFRPQWVCSEDDMRAYIGALAATQRAGQGLAFATIAKEADQPVGSSGYHNVDRAHRRLEVGGTWVAKPWQRSAINTEAKLLMLEHAFETLGCVRVEFKTDSLNTKSRRALEGIGAVQEGIFRNHMVMPDGRLRHSVYFSIIDAEWPAVKARLTARLAAHEQ